MKSFNLHNNSGVSYTQISNIFIDEYMPSANGTYVKVYITLIRMLTGGSILASLEAIADVLEIMEADVVRALTYWEKQGLLAIRRDSSTSAIADVYMTSPKSSTASNINICFSTNNSLTDAIKTEPVKADAFNAGAINAGTANTGAVNAGTANAGAVNAGNANTGAVTAGTANAGAFTASAVNANAINADTNKTDKLANTINTNTVKASNKSNGNNSNPEEFKWLVNIVEQYMEHPLSPSDVELVDYIYNTLHFSTDLILYLYEYCVGKNKTNVKYIQTVAINWANDGIETVERAKQNNAGYDTEYIEIMRAFGFNKTPAPIQKQYIDSWLSLGFSIDMIKEAANRTLLKIYEPNFNYANGIIEKWFAHNVKTTEDLKKIDELHSASVAKAATVAPARSKKPVNSFNSYEQRSYSKQDYSVLEKQLLNQ